MPISKRLFPGLVVVLLSACSAGEEGRKAEEQGEHVWKTQTDALEKAKRVEGLLDEAAGRQLATDR